MWPEEDKAFRRWLHERLETQLRIHGSVSLLVATLPTTEEAYRRVAERSLKSVGVTTLLAPRWILDNGQRAMIHKASKRLLKLSRAAKSGHEFEIDVRQGLWLALRPTVSADRTRVRIELTCRLRMRPRKLRGYGREVRELNRTAEVDELYCHSTSVHDMPHGNRRFVRIPLVRHRLTRVGPRRRDPLTGKMAPTVTRKPLAKRPEAYLYLLIMPRIIVLEEEETRTTTVPPRRQTDGPVTREFRLTHTPASQLAPGIRELLAARQVDAEVAVHKQHNALRVTADAKQLADVERLIAKLDVKQTQIMWQARHARVSVDTDREVLRWLDGRKGLEISGLFKPTERSIVLSSAEQVALRQHLESLGAFKWAAQPKMLRLEGQRGAIYMGSISPIELPAKGTPKRREKILHFTGYALGFSGRLAPGGEDLIVSLSTHVGDADEDRTGHIETGASMALLRIMPARGALFVRLPLVRRRLTALTWHMGAIAGGKLVRNVTSKAVDQTERPRGYLYLLLTAQRLDGTRKPSLP
jgi:type II/III secretion system protein